MRCQPGLKNEVRANFSLGFARSCVPCGRRFLSLPAICAQAVLLVIQKEAPSNDLGGKDSQSRKQRKCGCVHFNGIWMHARSNRCWIAEMVIIFESFRLLAQRVHLLFWHLYFYSWKEFMANINAILVDQQLTRFLEKYGDRLTGDDRKKRSTAFLLTCMKRVLDISDEESFDLLTDGPHDAGIDGIHIGDVVDNEFIVTVFQAKYKHDLETNANFPATAVTLVCAAIRTLFDPHKIVEMNPALAAKVADIRSLIADAFIPRIKVVLCNNGDPWDSTAQKEIDDVRREFNAQVEFHHFNHVSIVQILSKAQTIDTSLNLQGKIIAEDQNFLRVLIGRIHVRELVELYRQYGDLLLQRNIRRYLGLNDNRVNQAMSQTLTSEHAENFYCYNNGLTVVCDKFTYNALQQTDHTVRLKNFQIVNGGQTCRTIYETLKDKADDDIPNAFVMIRVYEIEENREEFVRAITYATNSQNPVDLRDLHSNDAVQKQLEIGLSELGYVYKRKRDEFGGDPKTITSTSVAEAVLAIWREQPHQAKFFKREHFGKLYDAIFENLNAAQALLAVMIFRDVESRRKKHLPEAPIFAPYASHYAAMIIGRHLLKAGHLSSATKLDHRTIDALLALFEAQKDHLYQQAVKDIQVALLACYGDRDISLQQLSATFRRGDLLSMLAI